MHEFWASMRSIEPDPFDHPRCFFRADIPGGCTGVALIRARAGLVIVHSCSSVLHPLNCLVENNICFTNKIDSVRGDRDVDGDAVSVK